MNNKRNTLTSTLTNTLLAQNKNQVKQKNKENVQNVNSFFSDIEIMLQTARTNAYRAVNSIMVETYWHIGRRIVEEEQNGKTRAEYGERLIEKLSKYLTEVFGKGFSEANLWNMKKFYLTFPQFSTHCVENLNNALSTQFYTQFSTQCVENLESSSLAHTSLINKYLAKLSWTNIRTIMRIENPQERDYYLQESAKENWTARVLERNIKSAYYYRLLSTQEKSQPTDINLAPDINLVSNTDFIPSTDFVSGNIQEFIKDPYVLEFLNLPEDTSIKESVLEKALIENLQKFLLELGKGFSFVARQERISTETEHFYVDLVFYNYLLKCFVIIDLKTTKLSHADIGQMDMYVRMFDALKRGEDDNPTIGIILCTDKSETMVKYSVLKESTQIFASKYKTLLPTEEELAQMIELENRRLLGNQLDLIDNGGSDE